MRLVIFVPTAFVGSLLVYFGLRWDRSPILAFGCVIICIGVFCIFTAVVIEFNAKKKFDQKTEELEAKANVASAVSDVDDVDDKVPLSALIKLNRAEMAEYHALVKAQAHRAFQHCQLSMAAGFAILLAGAVTVALPAVPNHAKYAVAALAAVGAAISGYITRTFLRNHELV